MALDPRALRNTLGNFATGVCLVTALDGELQPQALTVNSFSSVSLDPPLVLWSLQNNSEAYDIFATPQHYAINVLAAEQELLSTRYAQSGAHLLDPAHFTPGENGAPVITGALAVFECQLAATHEGGDHTIIVGRVARFAADTTREPLVFYRGGYRALAVS
ncbi:flavin reductase family protein [Pseudohaliea rubra]|uniref:Nitrilotriacetate monooxygenase component B n=1 Tax=Pseudohaliea rubra DSM 19751 TaxID=1265313 RepID=A0A095XUW8_9GAMM|nr:flavin reductase family protein [Pseudohaliea rubra]KGE03486.1 Nitrilotriacetate monooxygenase component B [Pseudohaliea rubra DSM 19751]